MFGDRRRDVIGAREQGLPCLGAGWGYGSPRVSWRAAGARAILPDPAALAAAWQLASGPAPAPTPPAIYAAVRRPICTLSP